jgi:SAM-dependent methyltransferase
VPGEHNEPSEDTGGLRRVLSLPSVYNLFQKLVGAERCREILATDYLQTRGRLRILDLGCGTAEILGHLPLTVDYTGYDISEKYIRTARKRFGARGSFHAKSFTRSELQPSSSFDLAIGIGLLHHLDDGEAAELLSLVQDILNPGGRFVSLDPCFSENQSALARFIIKCDRGRHVRTAPEYRALTTAHFKAVKFQVRDDLLRIPYTHMVMICTNAEDNASD